MLVPISFMGSKASDTSQNLEAKPYGDAKIEAQYQRYLRDTLASLTKMRGATGLVKDSIWVCWDRDLQKPNFISTEELTSPTNIGFDLLLLSQRFSFDAGARATLAKVLQTLSTAAYHHSNGLFFRTYSPDTAEPADIHLSSIDNLHLAFGLWVTDRALRHVDPGLAATARRLFDRMDFSDFFNEDSGLIGGNMRPIGENLPKRIKGNPQGAYKRDAFDYKYLGSETRSLYTLGWALGLYRRASRDNADFDRRFLKEAIPATIGEITSGSGANTALRFLRTWDGGGFQALLPGVLIREDLYSPMLGKLHHNYARRLLNDAAAFGVPAARSASAFGVRGLRLFRSGLATFDKRLPFYNGAAGHVDLVATIHDDVNDPVVRPYWDIAYTPHPAFMAATFARDERSAESYADLFKQNELISSPGSCSCRQIQTLGALVPAPTCECRSSSDLPNHLPGSASATEEPNLCSAARDREQSFGEDHLYQSGYGWMDGYYIEGPFKNRVIPTVLALDQSMIALSLYSLLSSDGHYIGSRSLLADPEVTSRLKTAYDIIDHKLTAAARETDSL